MEKAYERPTAEWLEGTAQLSKELRAVGMDGKERDISLVAFADDVFRKLVWDGHDKEEGVPEKRVVRARCKTDR